MNQPEPKKMDYTKENIEEKLGETSSLKALGSACSAQGKIEDAKRYFSEALQILNGIKPSCQQIDCIEIEEELALITQVLTEEADLFSESGNASKLLNQLEEAAKCFDRAGD
jgi:tetratricopeptide (TPR) repeat protein